MSKLTLWQQFVIVNFGQSCCSKNRGEEMLILKRLAGLLIIISVIVAMVATVDIDDSLYKISLVVNFGLTSYIGWALLLGWIK
jgi:hypothetical protein